MKKIIILVIINLFINGAIASVLNSTAITVPQLPGSFSLNLQGDYLQPSTTGHDLLLTEAPPANVSLLPGYDWGFAVGANYIIPETGNDIGLNYFHLNNRSHLFLSVPETLEDVNIPMIANISMYSQYTFDQIDLTAGQFIDIGNHLQTHLLAGVRWLKLDRKLSAFETLLNAPAGDQGIGISGSGYRIQESNLQAAGPLIAIDNSYTFWKGISLLANFDSALLIGDDDPQEHNFQALTIIFPPNMVLTGSASLQTKAKVVNVIPVVDTELGLAYQQAVNFPQNSNVIIKTGWRFSEYFNAVNKVSADIPGIKTANVGLSGPFVELSYQIG